MRYNADSCLVGILKKLTAIELSIHDGKLLTMLPEQVLRAFRLSAADLGVEYLGNHGGYSGAAIWRISERSTGQKLCLRRWPHSSDQRTRLAQIHTLLQTAVANGFQQEILPVPIATLNGEFWTEHKGSVYELTRWLPGIADYHEQPDQDKLAQALRLLSQFHQATRAIYCKRQVPPGVQKRLQLIEQLKSEVIPVLEAKVAQEEFGEHVWLQPYAGRLLQNFRLLSEKIRYELESFGLQELFEVQYCIRDVWHDHILFQSNEVSGIVDFGAVAVDSVAADVSRLLGSLVGGNLAHWKAGLSYYCENRELSPSEEKLIFTYDRSTTLLAGMNWLKWFLLENRLFGPPKPIIKRIENILDRQAELVSEL